MRQFHITSKAGRCSSDIRKVTTINLSDKADNNTVDSL